MKILLILMAAFLITGCREKTPENYRGTYTDAKTGATLTLKKTKGTLQLPDGTLVRTKTELLSFESLSKGQTGIYMDFSKNGRVQLDWIIPDVNTRQEEAGIVWFTSTVIFSDMNLEISERAQKVALMICTNGQVILDTESKTFQVGCGADALDLILQRK